MTAYVELLSIEFGDEIFRYCDGTEPQQVGGMSYEPFPFERGDIKFDSKLDSSVLKISFPWFSEPIQKLYSSNHNKAVSLRIFRLNSSNREENVTKVWAGRLRSCTKNGLYADLKCYPGFTTSDPVEFRRLAQRGCPYNLYSEKCGAAKIGVESTVLSVTSNGFTILAEPEIIGLEDQFVGGFGSWSSNGSTRRTLISEIQNNNTFLRVFCDSNEVDIGVKVQVYKGCDRTENSCLNWHNNILNFGGLPSIPERNPTQSIGEYL